MFRATRRVCLVLILLSLAASVRPTFAQEDASGIDSALQQSFRQLNKGKYLSSLTIVEQLAVKHPDRVLQQLATLHSFVGNDAAALQAMDDAMSGQQFRAGWEPDPLTDFRPVNAIDEIVARARSRQIVILNEAHHEARHRMFALQLARRLRAEGFDYFAAETFSPFISRLEQRGYPIRQTGYYSKEPVFGCLVREALELGFRPIAYEPMTFQRKGDGFDRINARETAQCKNLMDRVFAKDPEARLFVYVGYDHATENFATLEDGREYAWMAARLARESGIDPLTIDQTTQTERSQPQSSSPEWQTALENEWLNEPVVLLKPDKSVHVSGNYRGAIDMQVFHPPANRGETGRPAWLVNDSSRQTIPIPKEIAPTATVTPILVQAFLRHESDEAIPFDQVVLVHDDARPQLVLKPGQFRLVVQNAQGVEVQRLEISVDDDANENN